MAEEKKIGDIFKTVFNRNMIIHDGDYGIEIETETKNSYDPAPMKFWKNHQDGSLRNFGIEYVLKSPLDFEVSQVALKEFEAKTSNLKFLDSVYCSVHVHINMLNKTPLQLANFITTYVLLENILTKYSGPERESNLFCLSVKDAEGCFNNMMNVVDSFSSPKKIRNLLLNEDQAKYSALNFVTLAKIGSVELRTFRGSSNIDEIFKWLSIINKMNVFASQVKSPTAVFDLAYQDPREFVNIVFGDLAREFPYDVHDLIKQNFFFGAKLSTSVPSWDNFGQPKPKIVTKKYFEERLLATSIQMFGVNLEDLTPAQRILVEEAFERNINARHEVFIMEQDI